MLSIEKKDKMKKTALLLALSLTIGCGAKYPDKISDKSNTKISMPANQYISKLEDLSTEATSKGMKIEVRPYSAAQSKRFKYEIEAKITGNIDNIRDYNIKIVKENNHLTEDYILVHTKTAKGTPFIYKFSNGNLESAGIGGLAFRNSEHDADKTRVFAQAWEIHNSIMKDMQLKMPELYNLITVYKPGHKKVNLDSLL